MQSVLNGEREKRDAFGKESWGQVLQSLVGHDKVSDCIVHAKSLASFNI